MPDTFRRLTWPVALAIGSALAWALVRVIDDPGLRRSMVADPDDEVMRPEEEEILRERLADLRAGRSRTIPFEEVFPEVEAPR